MDGNITVHFTETPRTKLQTRSMYLYLQHGWQDPLVTAQGEEMVEVHGGVNGGRCVLPEEGTVLGVEQQRPVEDIEEQHHLVAPRVLTGHAQKHFLQQLDPQHLVEGVQTEQFLT